MDGKDLVKASVLAALVLVVGARFVVASAQARAPIQQCFDALAAAGPLPPTAAQDYQAWVMCLEAAGGSSGSL